MELIGLSSRGLKVSHVVMSFIFSTSILYLPMMIREEKKTKDRWRTTVVFHFYAAHFYAGFDEKCQNLSSNNFPVLCRFLIKFYADKKISAFIWKSSEKYTRVSQKSIKIRQKSTKIWGKSTEFVKNLQKLVKISENLSKIT